MRQGAHRDVLLQEWQLVKPWHHVDPVGSILGQEVHGVDVELLQASLRLYGQLYVDRGAEHIAQGQNGVVISTDEATWSAVV